MKNIVKLFAVLLLATVLAACSGDGASSDGDGPVEIEFWYGLGSEADEKMKSLIEQFHEEQDEVIVKPVPQADYDETYQKVQAAIASDTAPGVFVSEVSPLTDLAKKEVLTPLDDFLAEDDGFEEDDFLDSLIEPTQIDGSFYALPGYGTTQVMYYRKDIYEEAGLDPEEAYASWENLAEASRELVDQGLVDYGHMPMWKEENMVDIAWSNGGEILRDRKSVV